MEFKIFSLSEKWYKTVTAIITIVVTIVMNPPFSDKDWTDGIKPSEDIM